MESRAQCPYCGEVVEVWVDPGGASDQRYVEDCPVCCRPWEVVAHTDEDGFTQVFLLRQDD
ncbi:MAG: CPXCG motif-containing cysteine-rich protein [Myxococcales bacterium]|nr:CPXCG motif-containing cysteine-rich protein [Myxococcales bacterium]